MTDDINITQAAQNAIHKAQKRNTTVQFVFNNTTVLVYPESHYHDIVRIYHYVREIANLESKISSLT